MLAFVTSYIVHRRFSNICIICFFEHYHPCTGSVVSNGKNNTVEVAVDQAAAALTILMQATI